MDGDVFVPRHRESGISGGSRQMGTTQGTDRDPAQEMIMTVSTTSPASLGTAGNGRAIRPFRVEVPEEVFVDLRRRLAATRWPEKETVADQSQGVKLATIQ